jgi:hypothetical protein
VERLPQGAEFDGRRDGAFWNAPRRRQLTYFDRIGDAAILGPSLDVGRGARRRRVSHASSLHPGRLSWRQAQAGVAKLADARDLKSREPQRLVRVRFPPPAPLIYVTDIDFHSPVESSSGAVSEPSGYAGHPVPGSRPSDHGRHANSDAADGSYSHDVVAQRRVLGIYLPEPPPMSQIRIALRAHSGAIRVGNNGKLMEYVRSRFARIDSSMRWSIAVRDHLTVAGPTRPSFARPG